MALSAFDDRAKEPSADELRQVLGRSSDRWNELISHLEADQAPIDAGWTFAGAKWGWSLRLRRKKRTILYMTPCSRHFLVGFALGEKAVAAARESGLPDSILEVIDQARKYAEGRAVRLEIRSKKDVEAALRLAAIKMSN
jgi:hypothetical protein